MRENKKGSFAVTTALGGAVVTVLGFTSCNYNDLKNPAQNPGQHGKGASPVGVVDFATVKAQVFEPACIKCHGAVIAKQGVRLDVYSDAFAKLDLVRSEVESGGMPPPPPRGSVLSPEQKALLTAWIDSGAPQTTVATPPGTTPPKPPTAPPTVPPVPPTTTPDFAQVSSAVFVPHCIKCHSNTVQKGKVNLEQYTNASANAKNIGEALDTDDMPRRAPALPANLKAIVYAWIDGGAPETVATPVAVTNLEQN